MPPPNPVKSTVKRSALSGKKMPEALLKLGSTCSSGATCTQVTGSNVAAAALTDLQGSVATATTSAGAASKARLDARTAGKTALKDFMKVKVTLATYETSVIGVAAGDAAVINKAGLESRPEAPSTTPALGQVVNLTAQPWKLQTQARLRWPATPGAAMYAVQVSFTPQSPTGPFTSLGTTTRRTKVVKAPAAGAQFLVQVAAVSSDGTLGAWSDAVLATAH